MLIEANEWGSLTNFTEEVAPFSIEDMQGICFVIFGKISTPSTLNWWVTSSLVVNYETSVFQIGASYE